MKSYLVPVSLGAAAMAILLVVTIRQIRFEARMSKELRAAGRDGNARFIVLYAVMAVLCCLGLMASIPLICSYIWG